jgi:hypothetical protein
MPAAAAYAQNNVVSYVSDISGNDNNPCTITLPCAQFNFAFAATRAGGEIRCLDSDGFNNFSSPTVTITRSITIDCEGIGAAIHRVDLGGNDTGFIINGAGIVVTLRGLNLYGSGTGGTPARVGIDIRQAQHVRIEKCTIQNFTTGAAQGIRVATTAGATNLTVSDTVIANNGLGIRVLPSAGAALVSLQRVQMNNNSSAGFEATSAAGGTIFANIVDSTANGNGTNGIAASSFAGGNAVVLDIQRSNASLNGQGGILADGSPSKITIGASTVTANGTGFGRANGGTILSYGDNRVDNNTAAGSASGSAGQM